VWICTCFRALIEEKWSKAERAFQAACALDGDDEAALDPGTSSAATALAHTRRTRTQHELVVANARIIPVTMHDAGQANR
jgi:hypothetical protein